MTIRQAEHPACFVTGNLCRVRLRESEVLSVLDQSSARIKPVPGTIPQLLLTEQASVVPLRLLSISAHHHG